MKKVTKRELIERSWPGEPLKFPSDEWLSFKSTHEKWITSVQPNADALYTLPTSHIEDALRLFRLDDASQLAEREFAKLCDRHHAIGVVEGNLIDYPWLRPRQPMPNVDWAQFEGLGWSREEIDCASRLDDPTKEINQRISASLGRLISNCEFLASLSEIHGEWLRLDVQVRPALPLHRFGNTPKWLADGELTSASSDLAAFTADFNAFCDMWQLLGCATWRLPLVVGPLLTPGVPTSGHKSDGLMAVRLPWHFPLRESDGVGSLALEEQQRQAAEHGVEDVQSHSAYATFLRLYHWEHVLTNRYGKQQHVRGFMTKLNGVLASIIGLSSDRIQKLRKHLRALQKGSITSLKGRH